MLSTRGPRSGSKGRGLAFVFVVLLALFATRRWLVQECAFGGGMGGDYTTCACLGVEWEEYDHRPADGPRKTWCVGLVMDRTCYPYTGRLNNACE